MRLRILREVLFEVLQAGEGVGHLDLIGYGREWRKILQPTSRTNQGRQRERGEMRFISCLLIVVPVLCGQGMVIPAVCDGTTDDTRAFTSAIAKGGTQIVPTTARSCVLTATLTFTLPTRLECSAPSSLGVSANLPCTLRWTKDVPGIVISGPQSNGSSVVNLSLAGPRGGSRSSDGLTIASAHVRVVHVESGYFSRHGVAITSAKGANANFWHIEDYVGYNNAGDGLHVNPGTDVNGGVCISCLGFANKGSAIYSAGLVNTYIGPDAEGVPTGVAAFIESGSSNSWLTAICDGGNGGITLAPGASWNSVSTTRYGQCPIKNSSGNKTNELIYPGSAARR